MNIPNTYWCLFLVSLFALCNGKCPAAPLIEFSQNATIRATMSNNGTRDLPTDGVDLSNVMSGAYILMQCNPGYTLVSGQLNITCVGDTWTPFPTCALANSRNSSFTTLPATNAGTGCPVDGTTSTLANGYYKSLALQYTSDTTATGSIQFACQAGYTLDPTIGASYTCNNGVWSTKPRCIMSPQCLYSDLQKFISNISGMQTTGQSVIMQPPQNTSLVLAGSYAMFTCIGGYTNVGGSLNVTCGTNGQWSQFPNCVANSGGASGSSTIIPIAGRASCPVDSTTLSIANGYYSNMYLQYITNNSATGWIQFGCASGYVIDPAIGARYTCNNSVWSTKPRCIMTPRCSFTALESFTSSATGIQTTSQSHLMQMPQEPTLVLDGSYIVFMCTAGYTNIGGNLNVTCGANGQWSPFPNCVSNTGSGNDTNVASLPGSDVPCPVDANISNITNGYYTTMTLSYRTPTTATGVVQFACVPGYVLDPTIGALYTCRNGVWSPKPQCIMTGRCSFTALQSFTSTAVNIQTTNQSRLMQAPENPTLVLNESYTVFACLAGSTNVGGSLNVTCGADGRWSPFPNCVSRSGSDVETTLPLTGGVATTILPLIAGGAATILPLIAGGANTTLPLQGGAATTTPPLTGGGGATTALPPTAGVACPVDASTVTIDNGYYTNLALTYVTATSATGSIQFECQPGFALDSAISGSYVCNNGVWSTKPRCKMSPRCIYSNLQNFASSAAGLQTTGQMNLAQNPQDPNTVLIGSYITFVCISGFTNTGGSLNVTCGADGQWSPFPNCVSQAQTTTVPTSTDVPCVYSPNLLTIINGNAVGASGTMMPTASQAISGAYIDYACLPSYNLVGSSRMNCRNGVWSQQPACIAGQTIVTTTITLVGCENIPNVTNGYVSRAVYIEVDDSSVQRKVDYTCNPGYSFANTSSVSTVTCINGVWDQIPVCSASPICSVTELHAALVNAEIVSKSMYASNGGIVAGGWIQVECEPGYTLNAFSGSLNITCLPTGKWTPLPVCTK